MKWWRDKPWNDAPARPDLDGPVPPGPGCYRAAASDPDGTQDEYRAASCGDPECPEEHGDEDAPVDTYSDYFHRSNFGDDVPLAPWGGPAPQPPFAARRGLARAWFVRAAIVVLAVVLVVLLGWVR